MLEVKDIIQEKLEKQDHPKIVFADLDGTLFSPDLRILTAPLYNRQTHSYLKENSIPFVIATGRPDWNTFDKQQVTFLGFDYPDVIITAAGTIIYQQLSDNSYARNIDWENKMQSSKVTYGNTIHSWNKLEITQRIIEYLKSHNIPFTQGASNTFLIRIKVNHLPVTILQEIKKEILALFPKGLKINFAEKLLWQNTPTIFSGDILFVPSAAGKENSVKYILEKYSNVVSRKSSVVSFNQLAKDLRPETKDKCLRAFIFGDASVDVGMLTLKSTDKYELEQYAIHPTPLAQKNLKTSSNIHVVWGDGPKEILKVVTSSQFSVVSSQNVGNQFSVIRSGQQKTDKQEPENRTQRTENRLSPAQNNPIRSVIKKLEPLLDSIVDKRLSPNEVSFLGLHKLTQSLNQLHQPKSSAVSKIKGLYNYTFANLTDVLDGIRARQNKNQELRIKNEGKHGISNESEKSQAILDTKYQIQNTTPGQLVDGFSDRAKEFMQLFARAKKRLTFSVKRQETSSAIANETKQSQLITNNSSLMTLLAALSCALPSIARAQVEITGKAVVERDEKGGSMIDRTRKLFLSLIFDIIGLAEQSEAMDQRIYQANLATYQNRINVIPSKAGIKKNSWILDQVRDDMSHFQLEALERWLLYIDVLQQEDAIIKKYLSKHPTIIKEYMKESQKLAKEYLELPVNNLRKKWKIRDWKLRIKDYIH